MRYNINWFIEWNVSKLIYENEMHIKKKDIENLFL